MLHLRRLGLWHLQVRTSSGEMLDTVLDWWEQSERRQAARTRLRELDGVDPDQVIYSPQAARQAGLTSTVVFPTGNLAPHGSVVKATAIDPVWDQSKCTGCAVRQKSLPPSRPPSI
jgi:dihydroxyacid dehydratase/phosphogluconate dehydratase